MAKKWSKWPNLTLFGQNDHFWPTPEGSNFGKMGKKPLENVQNFAILRQPDVKNSQKGSDFRQKLGENQSS